MTQETLNQAWCSNDDYDDDLYQDEDGYWDDDICQEQFSPGTEQCDFCSGHDACMKYLTDLAEAAEKPRPIIVRWAPVRWQCWLLGCVENPAYDGNIECVHCGEYGYDFLQSALYRVRYLSWSNVKCALGRMLIRFSRSDDVPF